MTQLCSSISWIGGDGDKTGKSATGEAVTEGWEGDTDASGGSGSENFMDTQLVRFNSSNRALVVMLVVSALALLALKCLLRTQ
jgi:hypothetical protein